MCFTLKKTLDIKEIEIENFLHLYLNIHIVLHLAANSGIV